MEIGKTSKKKSMKRLTEKRNKTKRKIVIINVKRDIKKQKKHNLKIILKKMQLQKNIKRKGKKYKKR